MGPIIGRILSLDTKNLSKMQFNDACNRAASESPVQKGLRAGIVGPIGRIPQSGFP